MIKGDVITREEMLAIPAAELSDQSRLPAEPLVSVLVITYNHAAFLEQCLQSIVAQRTEFPIELVVGEDKSRDRTHEICLDYQKRYPSLVRVITSDANVGLNANFLRTLGRTRGKYVALCEGDDYWTDPDKLSKQVAVMEQFPDTVLCGARTRRIGPEGEDWGEQLWFKRPFEQRPHYSMEDLVFLYSPHTSTYLLRSDALKVPRCVESVVGVDYLLLIASKLLGEVRCLPEIVSAYRIHQGGVLSGSTVLREAEYSVQINEAILGIVDQQHEALWQQRVQDCRFSLCDKLTEAGRFAEARTLARQLLPTLNVSQPKQVLHLLLILCAPRIFQALLKRSSTGAKVSPTSM